VILVDTSVLIDALSGRKNQQVVKFRGILDRGISFGISPLIYLEVLQGAKSHNDYRALKDYLSTLKFYDLRDAKDSYEEAATTYFKCRKHGITLSSSVDCLIAQIALEHDLYLLHRDRDFDQMAKIVPLKIF